MLAEDLHAKPCFLEHVSDQGHCYLLRQTWIPFSLVTHRQGHKIQMRFSSTHACCMFCLIQLISFTSILLLIFNFKAFHRCARCKKKKKKKIHSHIQDVQPSAGKQPAATRCSPAHRSRIVEACSSSCVWASWNWKDNHSGWGYASGIKCLKCAVSSL